MNSALLQALPAEGRDPYGILSAQPGVVTIADRDQVDLTQDSEVVQSMARAAIRAI